MGDPGCMRRVWQCGSAPNYVVQITVWTSWMHSGLHTYTDLHARQLSMQARHDSWHAEAVRLAVKRAHW
eukprot:1157986-Pelagomonas_calceolata.AAC.3